jgi:4-amino-4-deoxy-L-arabinose transferase-like glycosyltransferase
MLTLLSFVPVLLVLAWLVAEVRGRRLVRVLTGLAALIFVAVVSFLWGGFAEAFKHTEFPVPHDSPADAAFMDGSSAGSTNSVSK